MDLWPWEELVKFEAEATRTYDDATTEQFAADDIARLLQGIPSALRQEYGLPESMEAEANSALCKDIKDNIFDAIKGARLAWVNFTAERDRLGRQPQAPLAPTHVPPHPSSWLAFSVGDAVIGHAVKHKESWNNFKGKVTVVFAKHYKVEMMEGPEQGQTHKYFHKDVTSAAPPEAAATGANPAAATGVAAAAATGGDLSPLAAGSAVDLASAASEVASAAATGAADDWGDFDFGS